NQYSFHLLSIKLSISLLQHIAWRRQRPLFHLLQKQGRLCPNTKKNQFPVSAFPFRRNAKYPTARPETKYQEFLVSSQCPALHMKKGQPITQMSLCGWKFYSFIQL
ncbi:MAG: hypothetical protein LUI12_06445, partial [Clostridiales bacterium]|nr:hypothetical protein [Clostridiales bacterium]